MGVILAVAVAAATIGRLRCQITTPLPTACTSSEPASTLVRATSTSTLGYLCVVWLVLSLCRSKSPRNTYIIYSEVDALDMVCHIKCFTLYISYS